MAEDSDKLFDPTPRRRQQARQRGDVAQSRDLAAAALLLVCVLLVMMLGRPVVEFLAQFMREQLGTTSLSTLSTEAVVYDSRLLLAKLSRVMLPVLGLAVAAGVFVTVVQIGVLFAGRIVPDWSRVSIARGMQRILSLSGGVRLGMGLLKVLAIVGTAGVFVWNGWSEIVHAGALDTPQLVRFLVDLLFAVAWWIGLALLALAMADFAFERWRYERDLRMTYQEFREEMRNQEADPQVDKRRRLLQQRIGRVGSMEPARPNSAAQPSRE